MDAGSDVGLAGRYVGEDVPPFVDWWAALLVLVLWIVVPLAFGLRRFGSADLRY